MIGKKTGALVNYKNVSLNVSMKKLAKFDCQPLQKKIVEYHGQNAAETFKRTWKIHLRFIERRKNIYLFPKI